MQWDLSVLYESFDDKAFQRDFDSLTPAIKNIHATLKQDTQDKEKLESVTAQLSDIMDVAIKLFSFTHLSLSVDAQNAKAGSALDKLMEKSIELNQCTSALSRYLGTVYNLPELIEQSDVLKANDFALISAKARAAHAIDENLEPWLLKMSLSGGEAFSLLRDKLDATHLVDYRGEMIPLSAVRAKAHDPNPDVRRDAYEAELRSYDNIALPMSFCLNSVKAEAETMRQAKHFDSLLDMTLFDSNMDKKTLDAMLTAMQEYLPVFRRYLKAKAKLLGHKGGLPFYDLFAPIGAGGKTYTVQEAQQMLVDAFGRFSPEYAQFIQNAFEQNWIDMYPREGKGGGAFCADIHCLGLSRILSNFVGSFSDVSTLAHELGHAFHNFCMKGLPTLMTESPMPLAETASIFAETMLNHQVLSGADADLTFALLEAELMDATQTVVDILSRYLFETEVIETRKDHAMTVDELKDAMLRAQDATYGDGLHADLRHPFMWACKSHYYRMDVNFYNFPYAFGLLFGKGVFKQYLDQGDAFYPTYKRLLAACGSDTIENVTASVGIDVTSPDFWRSSLSVIAQDVAQFEKLVDERV